MKPFLWANCLLHVAARLFFKVFGGNIVLHILQVLFKSDSCFSIDLFGTLI